MEPYLSGALTARGEVAAQGNSAADVMGSGRGTASLQLQDGEISAGEAIPYSQLDAELSFEDRVLTVEDLQATMLGGEVEGELRADFAEVGKPEYAARYRISGVDTEQLEQAVGLKVYLRGELDATGELTAQGRSGADLARSARSTAQVHVQGDEIPTAAATGKTDAGRARHSALDADLSWGNSTLTVQSLSGALFGGTVAGGGEVDFGAEAGPAYQVQYQLAGVDAAQLQQATGGAELVTGRLTAAGEVIGRGDSWEEFVKTGEGWADLHLVDGSVTVAGAVPVASLRSRLSLGDRKLAVKAATIEAYGGVITGRGSVDYAVADGPGYRLACDMKGLRAADFFNSFRVSKELSGRLDLEADLSARGGSPATLEKSLNGTVGMHLKKGVINRYAVLSKVFSILNVSQLFRLRLPDMVTTGMPYDRIDVNFTLKDGVAYTENLNLASPSLLMTAVGTSDLVKKEIDLELGVQPLQTVGKVLGRIPIVGWILTGGEKRFLVTYFDAKGSWDDPKVTTTTATALPQGVYNIFKRIFQLPQRLLTEPGEVIIGK